MARSTTQMASALPAHNPSQPTALNGSRRFTGPERQLLARVAEIEASPNPKATAKKLGMEHMEGELDVFIVGRLERAAQEAGLTLDQFVSLSMLRAAAPDRRCNRTSN